MQSYAAAHGFSGLIKTSIDQRGLVIRLLTDKVLFDSGHAELKATGTPIMLEVSHLLETTKFSNPIRVEGNTDNVPISSPMFLSNWELSTARADAVLQFFLHHGVAESRLSVAGYADQNPIAPNDTAAGRALNRRVDVVVLRAPTPSPRSHNAMKGKLKIILPVLLLVLVGAGGAYKFLLSGGGSAKKAAPAEGGRRPASPVARTLRSTSTAATTAR